MGSESLGLKGKLYLSLENVIYLINNTPVCYVLLSLDFKGKPKHSLRNVIYATIETLVCYGFPVAWLEGAAKKCPLKKSVM